MEPQSGPQPQGVYVELFKRHYRLIIASFLFVVAATWIFTKLSAKTYRGQTILFVHLDWSGDASLNPEQMAAGLISPSAQDYLVVLLKSDHLAKLVIAKLNLTQNRFFNPNNRRLSLEEMVSGFKNSIHISANFNRKIIVSVDTPDPRLSADIANAYTELLTSSIVQRTKDKVDFLKEQVEVLKDQLAKNEDELKKFEEKTRVINLDEQTKGLIGLQTDMERDLLLNQIKLARNERLSQTSGAIIELVQLEAERTALRTEIGMQEKHLSDLNAKMAHLPASSVIWGRLVREVKVKEEVLKMITQQYETSLMKPESDIVPFRVIDRAFPPLEVYRPVLRVNLILGAVVGLLFGFGLAAIFERWPLELPPPKRPRDQGEAINGEEVVW